MQARMRSVMRRSTSWPAMIAPARKGAVNQKQPRSPRFSPSQAARHQFVVLAVELSQIAGRHFEVLSGGVPAIGRMVGPPERARYLLITAARPVGLQRHALVHGDMNFAIALAGIGHRCDHRLLSAAGSAKS